MSVHPLLLRLLLLAVFFHTAIGVPWHQARHLLSSAAVVAQAHGGDADAAPEQAPSHHDEHAHSLCIGCHAYAEPGHGLWPDTGLGITAPARAGTSAVAAPTAVARAHAGHWRFASRDPPGSAGAAFG